MRAGEFHTSTKLDGYIWISGNEKVKHIPQNQAATVDMEDHDEDADEELDLLPRVQVFVKLGQDQRSRERCKLSREREETQEQDGAISRMMRTHLEDAAPTTRSEDRHGQFLD